MIARFGSVCARWAERLVPHPFVFALLLNALVLAAGLLVLRGDGLAAIPHLLGGWYDGFWSKPMLAFGFQMALILVTGYAVAEAPAFRRALVRVAGLWHTPAQAAALVTLVALLLSWLHWGLGLVGGAFLAREVGLVARGRSVPLPYPLIAASAYVGFLSWHGGLSGSAPLVVAQASHPQFDLVGTIPVARTIFSAQNLLLMGGFLVLLPLVMAAMARRAPASPPPPPPGALDDDGRRRERATLAGRLGHSPLVAATALVPAGLVLAFVLAPGLATGSRGFDLNVILFLFLMGALVLHGSPVALSRSIGRGAGEVGGILLQFPFYFAILGAMQAAGLVELLARAGADAAIALAGLGLPAGWAFETLTFLNAGLVNLFVPSGGGQWAVQGEIVLRAALDPAIDVDPARAVMALAWGDAWTNMLQPFWALALLSITQTRAREILGYTAAAMLLVLPLYLLVFAVV